jgi:hypothetical protein
MKKTKTKIKTNNTKYKTKIVEGEPAYVGERERAMTGPLQQWAREKLAAVPFPGERERVAGRRTLRRR